MPSRSGGASAPAFRAVLGGFGLARVTPPARAPEMSKSFAPVRAHAGRAGVQHGAPPSEEAVARARAVSPRAATTLASRPPRARAPIAPTPAPSGSDAGAPAAD